MCTMLMITHQYLRQSNFKYFNWCIFFFLNICSDTFYRWKRVNIFRNILDVELNRSPTFLLLVCQNAFISLFSYHNMIATVMYEAGFTVTHPFINLTPAGMKAQAAITSSLYWYSAVKSSPCCIYYQTIVSHGDMNWTKKMKSCHKVHHSFVFNKIHQFKFGLE